MGRADEPLQAHRDSKRVVRVIRQVRQASDHDMEFMFFCPGCQFAHGFRTTGPKAWTFNNDLIKPTIKPAVKVKYNLMALCESTVTDGIIRFSGECTHALAGQAVPLEPF
jgi:hypothetical protein